MRTGLTILIFILTLATASGQYNFHNPGIFYYPAIAPGPTREKRPGRGESPWVRSSIEMGIIFNSLNGFSSIHSYFSPKVFIPAGQRFSMR
ncbi:MAG: hypothetical protein R2727_12215 [Bacteroidales bacterium]